MASEVEGRCEPWGFISVFTKKDSMSGSLELHVTFLLSESPEGSIMMKLWEGPSGAALSLLRHRLVAHATHHLYLR